nr:MAG: biopolymer transporter ExbD [Pseudomonadota bacterium]
MGVTIRSSGSAKRLDGLAGAPEINVTPLVDVVLVLLIIFMVVAPALTEGAPIELPKVTRPDPKPKDMNPIEVAVAADGTVLVEGRSVSTSELSALVERLHGEAPERSLLLKADERCPYEHVRQTFGALQHIGFKSVLLKVTPKQAPDGAG